MRKAELQVSLKNVVLLAILLLIFVFAVYKKVLPFVSDDAKLKICKTSVFAASKKIPVMKESVFEVDCEMPTEEIAEDTVKKQLFTEDKRVYRAVADKLVTCWDMVGKGKLDDFDEELFDEKACLLCVRFTFDKDDADKKIAFGDAFGQWLTRNSPRMNDKKYNELLPSYTGTSPAITFPKELPADDIYYILIMHGPSLHVVSQAADFPATCEKLYN